MKRLSTLLPALFLAGCQGADSTPGAATPAEAAQLNDAAAMLDANSVDINAVTANSMDQDQPQ